MADTFLKSAIHNALMAAVRAAKFYKVTYDGDGENVKMVTRVHTEDEIRPASIEMNETKSTFTPSEDRRTTIKRRRTSLSWVIEMTFDHQVAMEAFEDALTRTIDADAVNNVPGFHIALIDTEYVHPPRNDPETGTWAHLVVEVEPQP